MRRLGAVRAALLAAIGRAASSAQDLRACLLEFDGLNKASETAMHVLSGALDKVPPNTKG